MSEAAKKLKLSNKNTDQNKELVQLFLKKASAVILDKEEQIKQVLCCLLANGHILIEDMPGMGKTTLVKTFASLLGLNETRIQFTNDLLPADLLGSSIYDPKEKEFNFHAGPLFSQLILADELNRATPKTQSACLQAMEERQVSVDGVTRSLPSPFFVIATQNPRQTIGTYPLPESQLDRFLMKIHLGFPGRDAEKKLLLGEDRSELIKNLEAVLNSEYLEAIQKEIELVHTSDPIIEYIQDLLVQSRSVAAGLSPRAALQWLKAAKAWAYIEGRNYVIPEDIQSVGVAVMNHRLSNNDHSFGKDGESLAREIIESVAVRI